MSYRSLGHIVSSLADALRPPERLTVSEAAEKYVYINQPGAYVGYYQNRQAPYMVEPQNEFTSRDHTGLVFVGPAQSSKTQSLILNTIAHSVLVDSMDMIVYCPSQAAARDFSTRRIDRMHRHSEVAGKPSAIGARLRKEKDADNKFDKHYDTGMILSLSWPSSVELAGRPIGRVAITDRDRMDDDIEKEGEIFDLASKRTTTFGSFAMTVCESSPSREITDPKWVRRTPHEAPPCGGILGLYNRGDRRRFYWPCPGCGSYFEGEFKHLEWDKSLKNPVEASRTAIMRCPACAHAIKPNDRDEMLARGRWLKEGEAITNEGEIYGDPLRTEIASFWLRGVAAGFTNWPKLVQLFITADQAYERTGDEEALKKFYNNDLGEPYIPKSMDTVRLPEVLQSRAEDLGGDEENPVVPEGTRFLVAAVDVQKNMFIVQVHGVLPGQPFDTVIVDRFRIKLSKERHDEDGQLEWVKPGTYLEDWDLITEQVIKKTYPLADGSGRQMMIKMTVCDSGGKAGVTSNAYQYQRNLRKDGLAGRFMLVKGEGKPGIPRARINFPDSSNTKNKAAAQGDVPVLMLNSNQLKDMVANRLEALVPGTGMIRFPHWLPDWFYGELCAENRTDKGWSNPPHTRNEAWDLLYYFLGVCASQLLSVEGINWDKPPLWADTWDKNNMITLPEQKERFASAQRSRYDFAALGKQLA